MLWKLSDVVVPAFAVAYWSAYGVLTGKKKNEDARSNQTGGCTAQCRMCDEYISTAVGVQYSTVFPRATGFHPSAAALFKHPVTACATQPTLTHSHTHSRVWFPQGANTIMKITSQQSSIKLTASPFPFSPPSRQETIKARHIAASSGFLSLQQNYSPRLWSHCWRVT